MQKTVKNNQTSIFGRFRAPVLIVVSCLAVLAVLALSPQAKADKFDEQINELNQQSAQSQQALNVLGAQAASYQDQINQLQSQISTLQAQITDNENRQADLQQKITANQQEIERQRHILASALKAMYVDDQMSTIEMLATSKNLSDYVDKEEYRSTVQSKIQATMAQIAELQKTLQTQKTEVENLLNDQKGQQATLNSARAQQSSLLAMNQSQQASYNSQIKANSAQVQKLRAQQEAAIAAALAGSSIVRGGACSPRPGNTYPDKWCNRGQDTTLDSWGMYNRECVSYTAWKVYESGHYMPYWGGRGNANRWDDNARSGYGLPGGQPLRVDNDPHGDAVVAIKNTGEYGHAMWVESVNDNGTINISQYNANSITDPGKYSKAYNVSTAGLVFIHF